MNVCGIDFSSLAIDIVFIDMDDLAPPRWHRFELVGQDAFDRTRSVRAAMPTASFFEDTLAIGIEHPAGKFGTGPMMRVQGAVLACLPSGVLVQPWAPSRWRAACGMPGNASKGHVKAGSIEQLVLTWGDLRDDGEGFRRYYPSWIDAWPQDAHDAHLIALATRAALVRPAEAAA